MATETTTPVKKSKKRKTGNQVKPVPGNEEGDDLAQAMTDLVEFKVPVQILPPPDDMDFTLVIPNPQSYKNLIDICSNVLDNVTFRVLSSEAFCGLSIKSFDGANVCAIFAKYACDTQIRGPQHFCVNMKLYKELLKLVPPRASLGISRQIGGDQIKMVALDSQEMTTQKVFRVSTIEAELQDDIMNMFQSDYTVEIYLSELSELVKTASSIKAEELQIRILEPKVRGPVRVSYLVLSIKTLATEVQEVYSSHTEQTDDDNGPVVIKTAGQSNGSSCDLPEESELEERVNEKYSVIYLAKFLSGISIKRDQITMRLSSQGNPMVLYYSLGGDSSISFVLLGKAKE
jgi:hypothetical protein